MAALSAPASHLAKPLPLSRAGAPSRAQEDGKPRAEATADRREQFPDLIAGLVGAAGDLADDAPAPPSERVPRPTPDTPADIEALLGGTRPALYNGASPRVAGIAQTTRRAGKKEQSVTTSNLSVLGAQDAAPAPVPSQPQADKVTNALQLQPALSGEVELTNTALSQSSALQPDAQALSAAEGRRLAVPQASVSMPATRGGHLWLTGQVPGSPEKTLPVELEATSALPASLTPQVASAADRQVPLAPAEASVHDEFASNRQAIRAGSPPADSLAIATPQYEPAPVPRHLNKDDIAAPVSAALDRIVISAPPVEDRATAALPESEVSPTAESSKPSRRSSGSVLAEVLALSGQMPGTVDSALPAKPAPQSVQVPGPGSPPQQRTTAPSETPAKIASQDPAASLAASPDTQVRALASGTPDRGEIAFAVEMKAAPAPEDTVPRESQFRHTPTEGSRHAFIPPPPDDASTPEPKAAIENRQSLPGEPEHASSRTERERHPESPFADPTESPASAAANKIVPHAAQDAQVKPEVATERSDSTAAKPVRTQGAVENETRPEASKPAPVRDVKFEVTGGEHRVEVRLSERGGEVKMTVRTPDAHLASALREDLPALTARLEESGFRSEAWHPAASSPTEWRHATESSAANAFQDANSQSREHDREPQDGAGQRHPKSPQEPTPQKEKGRDFAWLMSSLR